MSMAPYDTSVLNVTDANIINYSRITYPNPFFDLSRHYYPKTVKTLFKYCRIFFVSNEFIHNVILKLSEYPITDLIYEDLKDPDIKEKYEELMNHYLRMKSFLIDIGLDYFTFGNCIISANMKFKKHLECSNCGFKEPIEKIDYKFENFKFRGTCKGCNQNGIEFAAKDEYLKNPRYLKFIRWSPENITIDYDELTGESRYFYTMNEQTKKAILNGKKDVIARTPTIFLDALRENKKIELDARNLYHFKRPTLAEEDMGWGKPLLLPSMKMLWYMQTLRRGNEAIVADHLIPMRSIYPASTTGTDPFTSMNLGEWRSNVEENLTKWRRDPNHIGIFPVPIGYQSLGGDAKVLMVTPEMKYLEESIINALGVPIEFIKGGSTWTSSSVSLRIVENHFLQYREQLEDFLNYFAIPKISHFLDYPKVKVSFKKFKMSDDVQEKELYVQMSQLKKVSDSTFHRAFGIDPDEEQELKKLDTKREIDIQTELLAGQTEATGKAQIAAARYMTLARYEAIETEARIKEKEFTVELIKELKVEDKDPSDVLRKYAIEVSLMDPKSQQETIEKIAKTMPYTFMFVNMRMQLMVTGGSAATMDFSKGVGGDSSGSSNGGSSSGGFGA